MSTAFCPTSRNMPPDVEVIRGELLKSIRHNKKDESLLYVGDHLDLYGTDEWVLGSNFEDGTFSLVRRADETWALRDRITGNDSPIDDPLGEARHLLFG